MSRRRKLRLARTVLVAVTLLVVLPRLWGAWAELESWERASASLFISAGVLTIWGCVAMMREHRLSTDRRA